MGQIHAIQSDGNVVTGVEVKSLLHHCSNPLFILYILDVFGRMDDLVERFQAFRRLYEEVGLGWVYTITKYEPVSFSLSLFLILLVSSCKIEFKIIFLFPSSFVLCSRITHDYLQIGKVADAVYDFWAKYRLQVTGIENGLKIV